MTASFEQRAVLIAWTFLALLVLVTVLEERFGVKDQISELVREAKRRKRAEQRDAVDVAVERVGRWRKMVERKALVGKLNGRDS